MSDAETDSDFDSPGDVQAAAQRPRPATNDAMHSTPRCHAAAAPYTRAASEIVSSDPCYLLSPTPQTCSIFLLSSYVDYLLREKHFASKIIPRIYPLSDL